MSVPALSSAGTPVNEALEPAWVRKGSARVQQDYQAALGFEQVLTQQLTSAMSAAGEQGSEEEGGEGEGSQGGSGLSSLLPQALSQGIASGGGLGLAAQLTRDMLGPAGMAPSQAASGAGTDAATGTPATSPTVPATGGTAP